MKTLPLLGFALSAVFTSNAFAALRPGDTAPEFTLQASQNGKAFSYSLKDKLKAGPVVVYFYPSAYTGGCNIQAHDFSAKSAEFAAAGASIVGVSLDSIARLNDFSADPNYCAGKFPVAADDGKTAKSYDLSITDAAAAKGQKDTRGAALDHAFAERTTFIVTPDGKIAAAIGGLSPAENVAQSLEAVKGLKK